MPARVLDVRWDGEVEAEVDDEGGIDGSSDRAVAGVTTPGAGVTP